MDSGFEDRTYRFKITTQTDAGNTESISDGDGLSFYQAIPVDLEKDNFESLKADKQTYYSFITNSTTAYKLRFYNLQNTDGVYIEIRNNTYQDIQSTNTIDGCLSMDMTLDPNSKYYICIHHSHNDISCKFKITPADRAGTTESLATGDGLSFYQALPIDLNKDITGSTESKLYYTFTTTNADKYVMHLTNTVNTDEIRYRIYNDEYSYVHDGYTSSSDGVRTDQLTKLKPNTKYYLTVESSHLDDYKFRIEAGSSVSMYRLYNRVSGEHLYTSNATERKTLVQKGWRDEGIGWTAPATSNTPVYRLYNPNSGDHHYTTNATEKDTLAKAGWRYEGIGWYSDDAKSVPLYREYNPNAKTGTHNYTTKKSEHDFLVKNGWKNEGIGWYGCAN